jgi:hypothetical protein
MEKAEKSAVASIVGDALAHSAITRRIKANDGDGLHPIFN